MQPATDKAIENENRNNKILDQRVGCMRWLGSLPGFVA
jgi:hypothetical protein